MARLGMGTAILVSVVLGIILLYLLGISGMFSLIILGFAATYLTNPDERTYKIGGFAGIVLAILIFVYGLFIWPILPITLPRIPGSIMFGLQISGFFSLISGLILTLIICFFFGAIGGLIAQKLLKKRVKKPRAYTRRNINKKSSRKPRKTLNRTFKN